MKRLLSATAALVLFAGCNLSLADQFRLGLPTQEMVELNLPGRDTATGKMQSTESALEGERADSYRLTRGATLTVNGGTLFVLGLLKAITDHRPTTVDENQAVWGPYEGDPLAPNMWKLTVQRVSEDPAVYSYALEGKDKTLGDDAWVIVLSGSHTAGVARGFGSGTFLIDWDQAQTLPEHDNNVGTAEVTYARVPDTRAVTVAAEFVNVHDGQGGLTNASYRYAATPGQGGRFDFMTHKDVHGDGVQVAEEKLTVHSRWLETGAGRSDYRATEGDLTGEATGNECWDTAFNSQYLNLSFEEGPRYGVEATDCAIVGAEYSTL